MSTATDPSTDPSHGREPDAGGATAVGAESSARSPLHRRLRFLITPKWIALIIGVIAFAMACYLILAPWQFGRNSERSAQNAAIEAAQNDAPVSISSLMSTGAQPDPATEWHRVSVTGTFLPDSESYARLRQDADGNPASEVLVSLRTADGGVVLVDRGYVSASSVTDGDPLAPLPSGTVTVIGRVQRDETDPLNREPQPARDGRPQYYAINSVQATGDANAYRGYLQLTEDSPGVLTAIGMPQRDSGPFLSYALQWLAFGAMAVFGIGYFIYRELTEPVGEVYLPDDDPTEDSADSAAENSSADDPATGDTNAGDTTAGDPTGVGPTEASAPGPTAPISAAAAAARPRRRRFDRSDLYDPE